MESTSLITAALAVVLIMAKIVLDELRRKRELNGHNPSLASLDKKLDLMAQSAKHFRERVLETLKEIRDALERANR